MAEIALPAQNWVPRDYQVPYWEFRRRGGRRACLCWPRRHGKDHLCINDMAYSSLIERVGSYYYVMPFQNQARRVVWNGIDRDGKRFIDAFPKELVDSQSNAEMRLHLKNGSIFQLVGGDNPDKLVGANPVGVVFSEYALTNPLCWQLVAPILIENGGWVTFNSTPRGRNHFRRLLDHARANAWNEKSNTISRDDPKPNQWLWAHETAKTLKQLTADDLRQLRDELKDEPLFQQEAFCSFEAPMQGSYYDRQMEELRRGSRLTAVPVDRTLQVYTGWDLGMDDCTAIWFAQLHGQSIRLVHYFEKSGEGLPFYARYLDEWARRNQVTFARHFAPHDIKVREIGTGKTRLEIARRLGIRFDVVKKLDLADGIEEVRATLPKCWMDLEECSRGIDALTDYRKEWDESSQTFKSQPLHDWASHGADAFRSLALGLREHHFRVDKPSLPMKYESDEYNPFY